MRLRTRFYLSLAILQIFLIFIVLFSTNGLITFVAAQEDKITNPTTVAVMALSAAIALGASAMASAWALKTVATAAISSVTEREGGSIVVQFISIAMCESIAIYGLIVALLLIFRI